MANEIAYRGHTTGLTLYAHVRNAIGQIWNGSAFEAPTAANWGNYDIALTEADTTTRLYRANMPAVAAGVYQLDIFQQAGGSPAIADSPVGVGELQWDGSAVLPLSTVDTTADAILLDTGTDGVVLANDAITAAKIAADAIGSSELAASAVAEIQSGLSTLDAAGVRSAVGLAAANLDTQLAAIDDAVDTEVAAILAAVDTEVAAIKAKTDNLPSDPADQSAVEAAITAAVAALQTAVTDVDGYDLTEALKLILAACAGEVSGAPSGPILIRAADDSKVRITATVDGSGNRTALTLDETG